MPHAHIMSRIRDFDPTKFTNFACSGQYGHSALLGADTAGQDVEVQTRPSRLWCTACGSRECDIRIVFTRAVEFESGER